jgi:hypothetical protein
MQDDDLPTWAHTLLLFLIVSPFALPLIWLGLQGIHTHHLEPVMGPDFGVWLVGPKPVDGRAAVLEGLKLILLGCGFLAIAAAFSRFAEDRPGLRRLPWILLGVFVVLTFWIKPGA